MNITAEKNEIIKWVNSLENPVIIEQINKIRKKEPFDFEKEWARSITSGELKQHTKEFLKSLHWEK